MKSIDSIELQLGLILPGYLGLRFAITPYMINLIVCLFLNMHAGAYDATEPDKIRHVNISAGSTAISYTSLRGLGLKRYQSALAAIALTLTAGHLKETNDSFYDSEDMHANVDGSVAGLLVPLSIDWAFD